MSEVLYDFPCSETFRQHERYWQGEGLYSEPVKRDLSPIPPQRQDYFTLGRMAYIQHQVDSLKKGFHTHKKRTKDYTIK